MTTDEQQALALNATYWRRNLAYGLSGIGMIGGIAFAIKTKSGFWKGLGYAIVGSLTGSFTGYFVGTLVDRPKEQDAYAAIMSDVEKEAKPTLPTVYTTGVQF